MPTGNGADVISRPMLGARRAARGAWPLEMVFRAAAAGWRVGEVPVAYLPRSGRLKVTGTVRGTLQAVRDMRGVLAEVEVSRR